MRGDEPKGINKLGDSVKEFPACAGMNRSVALWKRSWIRVPRMRGDEPFLRDVFVKREVEFPACAGMNRLRCQS